MFQQFFGAGRVTTMMMMIILISSRQEEAQKEPCERVFLMRPGIKAGVLSELHKPEIFSEETMRR
jgi:hypothetical protein